MLHACQFMLCMDYESEIKIYYIIIYIVDDNRKDDAGCVLNGGYILLP